MVNLMETVLYIIAILAVVIGTCFSVVGVLGFFRLPDVYTRLHATGMVSVFGVVLLLVAAAVRTPVSWAEALVLIFFLLAAGPPAAAEIRLREVAADWGLDFRHHHGGSGESYLRLLERARLLTSSLWFAEHVLGMPRSF